MGLTVMRIERTFALLMTRQLDSKCMRCLCKTKNKNINLTSDRNCQTSMYITFSSRAWSRASAPHHGRHIPELRPAVSQMNVIFLIMFKLGCPADINTGHRGECWPRRQQPAKLNAVNGLYPTVPSVMISLRHDSGGHDVDG